MTIIWINIDVRWWKHYKQSIFYKCSYNKAGTTKFFLNRPIYQYFWLCRPKDLCHNYSILLQLKEPQTTCKHMSVAVVIKLYGHWNLNFIQFSWITKCYSYFSTICKNGSYPQTPGQSKTNGGLIWPVCLIYWPL